MEQKRLPVFSERFAKLRGDMTQGEFAEFLGISRPTVGFYENGTRVPDAVVLKEIAKKCKVSSDWLLGLSDFRSKEDEHVFASEIGLTEWSIKTVMAIEALAQTDGMAANVIDGMNMILEAADSLLICGDICWLSKKVANALEYEKNEPYKGTHVFHKDLPDATILMGFDSCEYDLLHIKEEFSEFVESVTGYDKLKKFTSEKRNKELEKLLKDSQ